MDAEYFIRVIIEGRDNLSRALATSAAQIRAWRREVQGLDTDLARVQRTTGGWGAGLRAARNDSDRAIRATRLYRKEIDDTNVALLRTVKSLEAHERGLNRWGRMAYYASNAARGAARSMFDLQRGVRDVDFQTRRSQGAFFNFAYNISRGLSNAIDSFTRMNTIAALLAPILFTAVTAVVNLAAALVAVASAAAMAAAALGGALMAAVSQLIPVVGLLAAAFHRLSLVMKAAGMESKASGGGIGGADATSKVRQHREAVERLADAQWSLKQAYQAVADAAQSVKDAETQLADARKQAQRDLVDAQFARQDAILAEKDATLSLLEAKRRLHELEQGPAADLAGERAGFRNIIARAQQELESARSRGDIVAMEAAQQQITEARQEMGSLGVMGTNRDLELRRARLEVEEAQQRKKESGISRARAIEDANLAEKRGIDLAPQVVAAQRNLARAIRSHTEALHALAKAQREVRDTRWDLAHPAAAGGGGGGATSPLDQLLAQLSPSERRLLKIIQGFKELWRRATRPLTDMIIDAIGDAILEIEKLLRDRRLLGAFARLADEIGDQIRRLAKFFTSPEQRDFFVEFTNLATKNLPKIVTAFLQLVRLAERVASAFAPVFQGILEGTNRWLGRQIKRADQPANAPAGFNQNRLGAFAGRSEEMLGIVSRFFGSLFRLLGAIISVASGPGGKALEDMANTFDRWSKELQTTKRQGATEFFERAIRVSGVILNLIGKLVDLFFKLSAGSGFTNFLKVLEDVGIPALENIGKVYGAMFSAIAKAAGNPFLGKLIELFATVYGISKLTPLGSIANAIIKTGIILAINANTAALWANTGSRGLGGAGGLLSRIPVVGRFLGPAAGGGAAAGAARAAPLVAAPAVVGLGAVSAPVLAIAAAVAAVTAAIILMLKWTGRLDDAWKAVKMMVLPMIDTVFIKPFQIIKALWTGDWRKLWQLVVQIFRNIFVTPFKGLWLLVTNVIMAFIESTHRIFNALWKWLKDHWRDALKAVALIIGGPLGLAIVAGFKHIWNLIKKGFDFLTWLPKQIAKLPGIMWRAVESIAEELKNIGARIVHWIVEGIKSAPSSILGAILDKIPGGSRAKKIVEGAIGAVTKKRVDIPGINLPGPIGAQGGVVPNLGERGFFPISTWANAARFAAGGIASGMSGAVPIIAHIGEWILNRGQQEKLARAMGRPVGLIRDWLFGPTLRPKGPVSEQYWDRPAVRRKQQAGRLLKQFGKQYFGPSMKDWAITTRAEEMFPEMFGYEQHPGEGDKALFAEPVFVETPLGQWVNVGRRAAMKMLEGKGFWMPEFVKKSQGFASQTRAQINAWKRANVVRGLGGSPPGGRADRDAFFRMVNRIMKSPLWNYDSGGVVGFSPSSLAMPSFASGGIITTPAVMGRDRAASGVNQQFEIHTTSPRVDVDYVMRVAKIHAESGF